MITGPLAEGAVWQGGSVGQLPSGPWCLSGPNVLTSWLPALEIFHLWPLLLPHPLLVTQHNPQSSP